MKSSGIGGQAVIEGVMMKNKSEYAIAIRKANNIIELKTDSYQGIGERYSFARIPIIRGIVAFVESMIVGMKTLTYSASFYEEEEKVKSTKAENIINKVFKDKADFILMGITIVLAIVMAVGIFIALPFFIVEILRGRVQSKAIRSFIEGLIRIGIFISYVKVVSQMKDIKRIFMYHGAEHKTINCLENGYEPTLENVKIHSSYQKRCGTSFILIVMVISIIFFTFIQFDNIWLRTLIRLLLVPIIAGIAYEFINLTGKSESGLVEVLSKPSMWLQGLTTREPDDSMIEVAIQSVDAVFDWKAFLVRNENKLEMENTIFAQGEEAVSNEGVFIKETFVEETFVEETFAEETFSREIFIEEEFREDTMKKEDSVMDLIDADDEEDDEILKALDRYFVYNEEEKM
jgi:uncharacterized protein YqhQ